jgi:hypothetical protein
MPALLEPHKCRICICAVGFGAISEDWRFSMTDLSTSALQILLCLCDGHTSLRKFTDRECAPVAWNQAATASQRMPGFCPIA